MNGMVSLDNLVSVSDLAHGAAGRTLDRVGDGNPVVIMRNNKPSAVLISTDDYKHYTEVEKDFALYLEAVERDKNANGHYLSHEEAFGDKTFDYSDADLEDVEFE